MSSQLMRGWPVNVIPYPIDIHFWSAVDRCTARQLLQLPQDATLILFGVDHGSANPRKGADLLLKSFRLLHSQVSSARTPTQLVVFGQQLSLPPSNAEVPYHYLGRLRDDLTLKIAYSAVDAIVIPSRQDNLPNIGLEAHACGKPVVAFKVGGLPDIIDDRITGALATPFDPESFAEAIGWVVDDADRRQKLGEHARRRAESLWAESVVAKQYADLYTSILEGGFSG
jgi:glycosyltransferase involved in cell wall biosynthesis